MKLSRISFSAVYIIFTVNIFVAQESILCGFGSDLDANGSISYSVGQVVYEVNAVGDGFIAPGIQQPYEIYTVSGINAHGQNNLSIKTYPNPTSDILRIEIDEDFSFKELSYEIFDVNGKLLLRNKLEQGLNINMKNYVSATYFLKIMKDSKEIGTFKVIKNG